MCRASMAGMQHTVNIGWLMFILLHGYMIEMILFNNWIESTIILKYLTPGLSVECYLIKIWINTNYAVNFISIL